MGNRSPRSPVTCLIVLVLVPFLRSGFPALAPTPRLREWRRTISPRELRVVLERAFEEDVEVDGLKRLPGGASRETWVFEASSSCRGTERLILRRDPPGAVASGLRLEAALLEAAELEGVPVPRVVVAADSQADLTD